jgi:hypothetical protein
MLKHVPVSLACLGMVPKTPLGLLLLLSVRTMAFTSDFNFLLGDGLRSVVSYLWQRTQTSHWRIIVFEDHVWLCSSAYYECGFCSTVS